MKQANIAVDAGPSKTFNSTLLDSSDSLNALKFVIPPKLSPQVRALLAVCLIKMNYSQEEVNYFSIKSLLRIFADLFLSL